MICSKYNVKLHVIENLPYLRWSSYLVDELEVKSSVSMNYDVKGTIHIINKGGSHFQPILKKTVEERFAGIMGDDSLSEEERIERMKDFFKAYPRLDINFQLDQDGNTPLHIAVRMGGLKIVKYLLVVGTQIDVSNREGKTPIDIAKDNNRKDIARILQPLISYKEIDVPGDGSCLFWSVALAYLTSVKFDDYAFQERFKKLFANDHDVQAMQRLIQDSANIYKDDTMEKLVAEVFRSRVINEIYLNQEKLKNKINMADFLESRSGSYFTRGTFKKEFEREFSAKKVKQCGIDTSKLKPDFFDENAVKEICTELNKIKNRNKVQQFIFGAYLECMVIPEAWGGKHEINAMSKLLETAIIVSQKGSEDYIYNEEKKYCNKVHLSYKERRHYQFYQVEYSNLIKFVLSFVQLFEIKLIIYNVLVSTLRQGNKMFPYGINTGEFVLMLSIPGFSTYTGKRIMSGMRASLEAGNIRKAVKNFISLSDLVEVFNEYKLGFRKILVDAGCNIFQSLEMQFNKIGFDHVSKIADDIIDKIIECYIRKEHKEDWGSIGIAEALVLNKYSQEVSDQIVQYGETNYNLRDLYENIRVAEGREGSFIYYRRSNKDSQHGYRRSLMGEKSKRIYETMYTRVETTNVEFKNYVYTLDTLSLRDFKDVVEQVFYIINKEIQVPSIKRIENSVVKIKSHIAQEVDFLSDYVLPYCQERKQSICVRTEKLTGKKNPKRSNELLAEDKRNSGIVSLMKENLKTVLNLWCYRQVKETFVSHAETIFQDHSNLLEPQHADTARSRNFCFHTKSRNIKALASLFRKMDFKDVHSPVEEFTGRQKQIGEMYTKLQGGAVVIIGPSGVGKTQLARKYVDENKKSYLHAYEVDTQDMLFIERAFASFVRDKLAVSMEEERDKGRKKYLFLFQGVKKEDVEKILRIRDQRGGFDCLFTSLDQDYKDIAEVALDNLEEEQAEQLVEKILGTVNELQNEQIKMLIRKLKNFPLAIKQAATCIKNRKLSEAFGICEYLTQYEDFDQKLPRNIWQNEYDRALQITSLISIEEIQKVNFSEEVNQILNTIAYLGSGQIDPDLFYNLVKDEDELYSILELLERYSIVYIEKKDECKAYIMHELVKKAIRSQLSIDEEKQVLSHVIKLVFETEGFYKIDISHFLSLFYHSYRHESLVKESCCLASTIVNILNTLCEYKRTLAFGSGALKILIAEYEDIAIVRYETARAMIALGEYDSALEIFLDLMQFTKTKGFEKRAQYYAAKAYSSQADQGDEYHNLKEIIFIAVADCIIFPNKAEYKSNHTIRDENTNEHDLKDFYFVFIELPKFTKTKEDQLENIVEKWCYFFRYAAETNEEDLDKIVGSDIIIKRAYEEMNKFNWSEEELLAYEQRKKRIMDEIAAFAEKFDEGLRVGEERGILIGHEKGKIEIAKNLLKAGISIDIISQTTGLPQAEIKQLQEENTF